MTVYKYKEICRNMSDKEKKKNDKKELFKPGKLLNLYDGEGNLLYDTETDSYDPNPNLLRHLSCKNIDMLIFFFFFIDFDIF